jgi:DNA primase small subunit
VETREVKTFDSIARKEIVDYISGLGLNLGFRDSTPKMLNKANSPTIPRLDDLGWRGRVAKGLHDFILYSNPEDYKKIGLRKNVIETIIQNKNLILRSMGHAGPPPVVKGLGPETWRKMIKYCAESLSAEIDTVVTTDIHRLIRLPGTLHSKTGFKKVEFSISHFEDFDPLKSAVAFRNGAVTIFVSDVPEFRVGDKTFGPYHNQKIELPTAAALLLICKKRAEVVEQDV